MKRKKRKGLGSRNKKVQKIRKRQRITRYSKLLTQLYKWRAFLIGATIIIFSLVLLSLGLKKTFLAPRYSIQELRYNPDSVATYDDPLLYSLLKEKIIGMNFFSFKRFKKNSVLSDIQNDYPLIQKIDIRMQDDQVAFVTIRYHDPALVFQLPENRRYASYEENLYPLGTGDMLGRDALTIELPRYSRELANIEGIYYRLSEDKLSKVVTQILETLGTDQIAEQIYLPGGEKLFITYKSKRLYFHLNKDIDIQLKKILDLEENFGEFNSLQVIDLGSSDDIIIR